MRCCATNQSINFLFSRRKRAHAGGSKGPIIDSPAPFHSQLATQKLESTTTRKIDPNLQTNDGHKLLLLAWKLYGAQKTKKMYNKKIQPETNSDIYKFKF